MGDLSLQQQQQLDPDDPKVELKVKQVLKEQVELLIHQAHGKARELKQLAKENANIIASEPEFPLVNRLEKPDEVLVRLRVEHAGFSALNNQRFGAQFIGQVANPVGVFKDLFSGVTIVFILLLLHHVSRLIFCCSSVRRLPH